MKFHMVLAFLSQKAYLFNMFFFEAVHGETLIEKIMFFSMCFSGWASGYKTFSRSVMFEKKNLTRNKRFQKAACPKHAEAKLVFASFWGHYDLLEFRFRR